MNLTIAIVSYNKREILGRVLKSVEARVETGDQIVIVDDGSSDGTEDLVESYVPPEGISYNYHLRDDKGYRLASARNMCIQMAIHDPIFQMDDDDLLTGRVLRAARNLYKPTQVVVFRRDHRWSGDKNTLFPLRENGAIQPDGDGSPEILRDERVGPRFSKVKIGKNLYSLQASGYPERVGSFWGVLLYSKAVAEYIGGYSEDYDGRWGCEDTDFGTRFYYAGFDVLYYSGEGTIHEEHAKREGRESDREQNDDLLRDLLRNYSSQDKFWRGL